jgi:trimethylamine--corrinoid protein Co-methyltransferase
MLSSSENFERWTRNGGLDTAARAGNIYRQVLTDYEAPPLDDAIREELAAYVSRRRTELGD